MTYAQNIQDSTLDRFYEYDKRGDGDGLRIKKSENGTATYYLRSTVLGGGVVAEINVYGAWQRGLVYAGGSLLAVQQSGVYWMHEDPVTKSKRVTNSTGAVVSSVELDPWGADTNRSSNSAFQPKKFTSYDRDNNGSDEAMFRRFNRWHSRFDQPDPYDGSYDFTNPQSFNRYAYVNNDPVNFTDLTGLDDVPGDSPIDPATGNPFFIPAGAFGVIINIGGWEGSLGGIVGGVGVSDRDVMLDIDMANFAGISYRQNPTSRPQLPPCNLAGSGDIGGEVITPFFVGPKGGVQLDNKGAFPYFGLAAGVPGRGVAITGGPKPVSPGLNIGFSGGSAIAISYSAHIDWDTNSFRSLARQLTSGSWQIGGQMPGASVNATVVLAPKLLQKNCR